MRRLLLPLLLLAACGPGTETAVERGEELASSPTFGGAKYNDFSCTTCHATGEGDARILPGYTLGGAVRRPSYWGGAYEDMRSAVDACLLFYMKGDKLDPEDPDARALYEYLDSLADRGPQDALPVTLALRAFEEPERGDPARGAEVHRLACGGCHGPAGPGDRKGLGGAPGLPDQAKREARELLQELGQDFPVSSVFVEKVRHGRFFGVGGTMPPFSKEALSDEDLGALLAFYGL
jgi:thiosulfate dehydrogenase